MSDSDNTTTSTAANRNAITQSINWGNARVNEEITINEDVAKEAVLRQYARDSNFADGDRYINIHNISGTPPMIAVDAYTVVKTPYSNLYSDVPDNITRSRDVVIYEAKDEEK